MEMVQSDGKEDSSSDCTGIKVLNQDWIRGRQEAWRLKEELEKVVIFFTDSVLLLQWITYLGGYREFRDFRMGEWVIPTVQYSDKHVLQAKEETVLQGVIDRLTEIERCYGTEINMEET